MHRYTRVERRDLKTMYGLAVRFLDWAIAGSDPGPKTMYGKAVRFPDCDLKTMYGLAVRFPDCYQKPMYGLAVQFPDCVIAVPAPARKRCTEKPSDFLIGI